MLPRREHREHDQRTDGRRRSIQTPPDSPLEVAYQVDHIAVIIRAGMVPAEPDLLEHPE